MKIVSWNIAGGHLLTKNVKDAIGYEKEDLDYFISNLKKLQADIICFQEVHISKDGKENQVELIAKKLGFKYFAVEHYAGAASHIKAGQLLGMGLVSHFPIISAKFQFPPNPRLTVKRPNGIIWNTIDMGMLVSEIKYKKQIINIINFHLIPVHYFGKNWVDKEFAHIREHISDLLLEAAKKPTIAIGDFNYADLGKIYPKIFSQGKYQETFLEVTTPAKGQQDHILYSNHWQLSSYQINTSVIADHYLCSAELKLK